MTEEQNISDVSINETIGAEVVEVPITQVFFTFWAIVWPRHLMFCIPPNILYYQSLFVMSQAHQRGHWIISDYCPQSAGLDNLSKKWK